MRQRTVAIVYEIAEEYGEPGDIVHVGEFTSSGTTTDFEEVRYIYIDNKMRNLRCVLVLS